jgi:hypothetical protein
MSPSYYIKTDTTFPNCRFISGNSNQKYIKARVTTLSISDLDWIEQNTSTSTMEVTFGRLECQPNVSIPKTNSRAID